MPNVVGTAHESANPTNKEQPHYMTNYDITRWSGSNQLARHQARNLTSIDQTTELAEARIESINRWRSSLCSRPCGPTCSKKQAEALAPDGAELYALIATAGAIESTRVIESLNRRLGRW